jgi:peptidoglycan/LPS O-acetylase OafA/YrhL
LASVIVIAVHYHHLFVFGETGGGGFFDLRFYGQYPVTLFFVLSGYVLSIPYWSGRSLPYPAYLIRRVLRIWVPYAGAVVVAVLAGSLLLNAQLPLGPWFYLTWHTPLTPHLILAQFFTMATGPEINTAFWSLRYEMEFSIVLPLVCWLMLRVRPLGTLIAVLLIARLGGLLFRHHDMPWVEELGNSLVQGSAFIWGALLAWREDRVRAVYEKTPLAGKALLLLVTGFGVFCQKQGLVPIACCGVIMLARYSLVRRMLDTTLPEYLGRISYSLYLLHGTVLWATMILLYGKVPLVVIAGIFLAITFGLSHLFCIGVEEPSMRLGKRLTVQKPRVV